MPTRTPTTAPNAPIAPIARTRPASRAERDRREVELLGFLRDLENDGIVPDFLADTARAILEGREPAEA